MSEESKATDVVEASVETVSVASEQEEWRNPKEIKRALAAQRELGKRVESYDARFEQQAGAIASVGEKLDSLLSRLTGDTQKKEEKPVDVGDVAKSAARSEVGELRRELEFRDAVDTLDVKLTPSQRRRIQRLWAADRPDSAHEWLADTVSDLGIKSAEVATTSAKESPKVQQRDVPQSPPALGSDKIIPDDPAALSRETVASMSLEDLKAYNARAQQKHGMNSNPWASKLKK